MKKGIVFGSLVLVGMGIGFLTHQPEETKNNDPKVTTISKEDNIPVKVESTEEQSKYEAMLAIAEYNIAILEPAYDAYNEAVHAFEATHKIQPVNTNIGDFDLRVSLHDEKEKVLALQEFEVASIASQDVQLDETQTDEYTRMFKGYTSGRAVVSSLLNDMYNLKSDSENKLKQLTNK